MSGAQSGIIHAPRDAFIITPSFTGKRYLLSIALVVEPGGGAIIQYIQKLRALLSPALLRSTEIIVVDDPEQQIASSTVKKMVSDFPAVHLMRRNESETTTEAIFRAWQLGHADICATLATDNEHGLAYIERMIADIQHDDVDMVIGAPRMSYARRAALPRHIIATTVQRLVGRILMPRELRKMQNWQSNYLFVKRSAICEQEINFYCDAMLPNLLLQTGICSVVEIVHDVEVEKGARVPLLSFSCAIIFGLLKLYTAYCMGKFKVAYR